MKLFVACPSGLVTGGVEALHQLVDAARANHWDAAIWYYPSRDDVMEAYQHYDVRVVTQIPDSCEAIVVVAETAIPFLANIVRSRRVIWWLSVDNFFKDLGLAKTEPGHDPGLLRAVCGRDSNIVHLTQSDYARQFLAKRRVRSSVLTDYLSKPILDGAAQAQITKKQDLVLYNPMKGLDFTERLIQASYRMFEWQPIQGLDSDGVAERLAHAKLYVDFGDHPGRDRIPREAAISGCCVITGRRGAAGNPVDLPIPSRFILDERDPEVVPNFLALAISTLANFDRVSPEFDPYRRWISTQRDEFTNEVAVFLEAMRRPPLRGAPVNRSKSARKR